MSEIKRQYEVVILGAGAAGLMCALTAAKSGCRVLLLEVSNKAGKKILMSGGGRCNFTNLDVGAENFICENPHFVKSALAQFTQWDFIAMVAKHGIAYHEKSHGQLFCDTSSKDILAMLIRECDDAGVEMRLNCSTSSIEASGVYRVETNLGMFSAPKLVVATGGLSIPTLGGATAFGYSLAKQFGLEVNATSASLVPFTLSGTWLEFTSHLAGVSVPVVVSVPKKGFSESLLFTHRGLSGPAILQLSNYWQLGELIEIDLLPTIELDRVLLQKKRENPAATINSVLFALLPKSLVLALQPIWWSNQNLHETKDTKLREIARQFHQWQLKPSGTEGFRTAEVTRGGVNVSQISSKTMQVETVKGLYFIGEVLDVTGQLGGYNFQWAWSSAFAAATHIVSSN